MSVPTVTVCMQEKKPAKLFKWKVKVGTALSVGSIVLFYDFNVDGSDSKTVPLKLKATSGGVVKKLIAKEGDVINPGDELLELQKCTHPTIMKNMCAKCGEDLNKDTNESKQHLSTSVAMVHNIPELRVSKEQAHILGKADEERLLKNRKLVLLVDLDQTLIHTTNDTIPPNIKDIYHFQLYGQTQLWYHTRLRPGTREFLKNISEYFELHICSFGTRTYAHTIAKLLDSDGRYFSHRILSRDECFNSMSKTANLKALFPCGDNLVCIIDDREDVWNSAANLVHVKPYHFFKHTGDINAPPGLSKMEQDDKTGYDFSDQDDKKKNMSVAEKSIDDNAPQISDSVNTAIDTGNQDIDTENQEQDSTMVGASGAGSLNNAKVSEDSKPDILDDKSEEAVASQPKRSDAKQYACSPEVPSEPKSTKQSEGPENEVPQYPSSPDQQCKSSEPDSTNQSECFENQVQQDPSSPGQQLKPSEPKSTAEQSEQIPQSMEHSKNESTKSSKNPSGTENYVDVEDSDDYLTYLEDILKNIHKAFYEKFNNMVSTDKTEMPDLKTVIPEVRRKTLSGVSIAFSGMIPNHVSLTKSKPYVIATSLGASVTEEVIPRRKSSPNDLATTHLVAARPGTAKVNDARRSRGVHIVTPDWLWCCAERWDRVDEKLFPLTRRVAVNRQPPFLCSSPDITELDADSASSQIEDFSKRKKRKRQSQNKDTGNGSVTDENPFDSLNPLMRLSVDDIADMRKEVESGMDSDSNSSNEDTERQASQRRRSFTLKRKDSDSDSSSSSSTQDSLTGDCPKGWEEHKHKNKRQRLDDRDEAEGTERVTCTASDTDDEMPSAKFRRGEGLPSDMDMGDTEDGVRSDSANPDEIDDCEWNMMGAALEHEFLSGNNE